MKRRILGILFLVFVVSLLLVSCDLGHTHTYGEWVIGTPSTCEEEGERYRVCDCGHTEYEPTPLAEHKAGDWQTTKEATCVATGEQSKYCTECNTLLETETLPINDNHTEEAYTVTPTCTENGVTIVVCSACDKELSETVITAPGHTEGDWIVDVAATCVEKGEHHTVCTVCGVEVSREAIPFADHSESEWVIIKEATKTTDGSKYKTCTVCNQTVKTQVIYKGSQGLAYTVNSDGTTCTVTGLGTCTDTELVIPRMIDEYTVTHIGKNAFRETEVTKVILPDDLVEIGQYAFYGCASLVTVHIPDGVNMIRDNAFTRCTSLTSITLPVALTSIGSSAFSSTSLYHVVIPGNVTEIGAYAFYECNHLNTITFGTKVAFIGAEAFTNCSSLQGVYITDVAAWCRIDFGTNDYANPLYFAGKLYLNNVLVTELVIPEGVTAIPRGAFQRCLEIRSVSIPASVTDIGDYAFARCSSLTAMHYGGTTDDWRNIHLGNGWGYSAGNFTITCTDGTISKD